VWPLPVDWALSAAAIVVAPLAAEATGNFGPPMALLGTGFVIAVFGHMTKIRWLIAAGLILIAIAAIMLQFSFKTNSHGEPPLPGPAGGAG
jgi:hypothetical protein